MADSIVYDKRGSESLAQEIVSKYNTLRGERAELDQHWTEIAERVIPADRFLFRDKGYSRQQGEKRSQEIYDSTAATALGRFTSILDSLLTPRNQTWHRLTASDPNLNKIREVRLWFEEVNRLLFKFRYAPKANFVAQNQSQYKSLGAYGSGCVFVDKLSGPEKGLRYRNCHLSEIYFIENHQGLIDGAVRHYPLTKRQALKAFPADMLPDKIVKAANDSDVFWFIHCVEPREDFDPRRVDYKGMAFASYNLCVEEPRILTEKGYASFPYAISRYEQTSGEVYGRSPAMHVLPAIKTLNEQKKTLLKQGHRAVDPILLTHDDGIIDGFSMRPGALNSGAVTADGRPLVHALPSGNVMVGKELMDDERADIKDAFFTTIFQILTENPQQTATEVLERTKEKGILLAPVIGRQQSEYLAPIVERELDLLAQDHLLPPMPPVLKEAKGSYQLEYDSPLTRAQRAEEAAGLVRSVESTLNVVNVTGDPSPLDFYDWDTIVPEISEIQGVPARWMRSMEKVQEIRAQRAEQMQAQQAIQAGPSTAALMKAGAAISKG